MENNEQVTEKTWKEFRATGLLFLINQLLHVFGWAIVMKVKGNEIIEVHPARVKYRGFEDSVQSEQHIKIANYMAKNAQTLKQEAES